MKPPLIAIGLLIVNLPLHALPVITSGPTPQAMFLRAGSNVTFSITATGNITPLKLQWRLNGTNIPGATNSTLAITNAVGEDQGIYTVLVADAGGAVGSSRTTLVVDTNEVAQTGGVLNFANAAPYVNAPVRDLSQGSPGVLANSFQHVAQLWVGPGGLFEPGLLRPTGLLALFSSGAQSGYFLGGTRFVPIGQPDDIITVQVRAFEWQPRPARAWQAARLKGESNLIQVRLGTNGSTVPNLVGLQPFAMASYSSGGGPVQPSNAVARVGESVQFTWDPSFCVFIRWEKDGAVISGTPTNLLVRNVQPADAGGYLVYRACDFSGESDEARLTVLFNPYFESAAVTGGAFHALIGGSISNSLTVESSTDLTNWTPELTVTNLDGFLPFDRDISTNGSHRFFRLVGQ